MSHSDVFLGKTIFSQSLSPTRSIKGYNGGDIEACEMQCTVEKGYFVLCVPKR